jgi:hypothetical protein
VSFSSKALIKKSNCLDAIRLLFEEKSQAKHDTPDIAPSNITKEELPVAVNHLPAEVRDFYFSGKE